jgi:putative membrane protein
LAIVFGIVNALIGPILRLVSAPITWLTHGLFSIVINWIVFGLAVWLMPDVKGGWLPTLEGAIILMIVGTLLQQLWKSDAEKASA